MTNTTWVSQSLYIKLFRGDILGQECMIPIYCILYDWYCEGPKYFAVSQVTKLVLAHCRMTSEGTIPALHDPAVLVVRLLSEPLIKRFTYHFTGHKKTNCIEKVC